MSGSQTHIALIKSEIETRLAASSALAGVAIKRGDVDASAKEQIVVGASEAERNWAGFKGQVDAAVPLDETIKINVLVRVVRAGRPGYEEVEDRMVELVDAFETVIRADLNLRTTAFPNGLWREGIVKSVTQAYDATDKAQLAQAALVVQGTARI